MGAHVNSSELLGGRVTTYRRKPRVELWYGEAEEHLVAVGLDCCIEDFTDREPCTVSDGLGYWLERTNLRD